MGVDYTCSGGIFRTSESKALSRSVIFLLDFITPKTLLVGAVNACEINRISSQRQNGLCHILPITLSCSAKQ